MVDFNYKVYKKLIYIFIYNEYVFQPFQNYLYSPSNKTIILRHDIDKNPLNALKSAQIEYNIGISASYYFRILPGIFSPKIIKQISELGHEIGYHYEDVALAYKSIKSEKLKMNNERFHNLLYEKAIENFEKNLNKLRKIYPVKTICMHGSPLSKLDNRDLWKRYDYQDFGIIGDPYFDVDFNEVLYLSDTGHRWNGSDVSVRDKVNTNYAFNFYSTFDIIRNIDQLPDKIMFNIHPQRWNDKFIPWISEYVLQKVKNVIKRYFFVSQVNK